MNDAVFDRLTHKLKELPMRDLVERAADRQEDLMIELNLKQMHEGIRADGQRISPAYRPRTVIIKKKKGQPVDRVTLRDTGDFYNAERVKKYPGKYELSNQDPKAEALEEKYGYQIQGLTQSNIQVVRVAMLPFLIKDTRNTLKQNLI